MCKAIDMTEVGEPTAAHGLGVLIKEMQVVLNQRMNESLRPLGLTVSQYACLHALADTPGITGSELARRAFVSRQSMNVLIRGLEERGLIERSEEPGPRRERATNLTPAAATVLMQARSAVGEVTETMTAPLDPDELTALCALLATCRDALLAE